ncbi:hypothetical protein Pcinc_031489 [Petrolisthes cinctipes]|uniref:Uncharacterized protein n=1 Tax=Petrolisthes cinctipes TaxID=88211 RepID=A0AAE1K0Z5_PETCI|nr:hypothetical protein Pcinc_031489 [Petrolisthes cinctipes]
MRGGRKRKREVMGGGGDREGGRVKEEGAREERAGRTGRPSTRASSLFSINKETHLLLPTSLHPHSRVHVSEVGWSGVECQGVEVETHRTAGLSYSLPVSTHE